MFIFHHYMFSVICARCGISTMEKLDHSKCVLRVHIFSTEVFELMRLYYAWQEYGFTLETSLFFILVLCAFSNFVHTNFMVTPYVKWCRTLFIYQLTYTTLRNVELLKHSKIDKNAPTCFGLHGAHLQGAKVSTWLKVIHLYPRLFLLFWIILFTYSIHILYYSHNMQP